MCMHPCKGVFKWRQEMWGPAAFRGWEANAIFLLPGLWECLQPDFPSQSLSCHKAQAFRQHPEGLCQVAPSLLFVGLGTIAFCITAWFQHLRFQMSPVLLCARCYLGWVNYHFGVTVRETIWCHHLQYLTEPSCSLQCETSLPPSLHPQITAFQQSAQESSTGS